MTFSTRLRYIDASHVEASVRDLVGFDVITEAGKRLGEFVGLIVDPAERRIRYLVVHLKRLFGQQRLLVPMSAARLDVDRRALQVELPSDAHCPTFKAQDFAPFSDEDLVSAMFQGSTPAARNDQ